MKTTTKIAIAGAGVIGIAYYLNKKKQSAAASSTDQEFNPVQEFEKRLVMQDNGNWFIIIDGKRWFTGSVQAIVDFQKAYPGNNEPIAGLTEIDLQNYPIAGTIFENLKMVPLEKSPSIKELAVIQETPSLVKRLGTPVFLGI